jgi:hypothetical protein
LSERIGTDWEVHWKEKRAQGLGDIDPHLCALVDGVVLGVMGR